MKSVFLIRTLTFSCHCGGGVLDPAEEIPRAFQFPAIKSVVWGLRQRKSRSVDAKLCSLGRVRIRIRPHLIVILCNHDWPSSDVSFMGLGMPVFYRLHWRKILITIISRKRDLYKENPNEDLLSFSIVILNI